MKIAYKGVAPVRIIVGDKKAIYCKDDITCIEFQDSGSVASEIASLVIAMDLKYVELVTARTAQICFELDKFLFRNHNYFASKPQRLTVIIGEDKKAECESIARLMKAAYECRMLASEPANVLTPTEFANRCVSYFEGTDIEVDVLEADQIEKLNMRLLLAVSKGSSQEPRVVIMRKKARSSNAKRMCLIGKGVCFDAGGLFLKSMQWMPLMKFDKSGAASVVGTMLALANHEVDAEVIGIIGLVENMPDGNSTRPSDVVMAMDNTSVEIVDPDAEGRLVLADCITLAKSLYGPSEIITIATLTTETIGALSDKYAGVFSRSGELAQALIEAGKASLERLYHLPCDFEGQLKSDIADIKNYGNAGSGECGAAAAFLRHFAKDTEFAHLDIAGTAWIDSVHTPGAKAASGFGVKLLHRYIAGK